uniref:Uncharacterized protein n=1 Tax=Anguilla anguilla TaxID=7936 RepID=A0A0E9T820_ANGAN
MLQSRFVRALCIMKQQQIKYIKCHLYQ